MKVLFRTALLAVSCTVLSAAPVTWYLNNVTFTDGGRAFGSFTYDSATNVFSTVNVQSTPAAATGTAASAVGGGNYQTAVGSASTPLAFVGSITSGNVRRLQLLANTAVLAAGVLSVPVAGTEGFCDPATCTNLVGNVSRSIASGQLVRSNPNGPATWYLNTTMADGSQAIGSFDFDPATGTYANVDVSITAGPGYPSSVRLRFARAIGNSPTVAVFQADQTVKQGTRVFVLVSPTSLVGALPGTTFAVVPVQSYQDACPVNTTPSCPATAPQNVVVGTIVNTRPTGYNRVVSQVADGAGWQTSLILTNTSDGPAPYAVTFATDNGTPFEVSGISSWNAGTVQPGGVAFLTSLNPATLTQGSAFIAGGQNFSVATILTSKNANQGGDQQGSVTGDAEGAVSFSVPFDNTGGAVSGFALTNSSPSSVTVMAVAYDEAGRVLMVDSALVLPAGGHTAFSFATRPGYSTLAGRRGLLRVFAIHPGATPPYPGLNGLLLKFLPNGSFTTISVNNQ